MRIKTLKCTFCHLLGHLQATSPHAQAHPSREKMDEIKIKEIEFSGGTKFKHQHILEWEKLTTKH